jgi:50S ribosomal subunit-associated GTPase HflX
MRLVWQKRERERERESERERERKRQTERERERERERVPLVCLEIVARTNAGKDTVRWRQAGIVGGHK